jgi:hypothetical protein
MQRDREDKGRMMREGMTMKQLYLTRCDQVRCALNGENFSLLTSEFFCSRVAHTHTHTVVITFSRLKVVFISFSLFYVAIFNHCEEIILVK